MFLIYVLSLSGERSSAFPFLGPIDGIDTAVAELGVHGIVPRYVVLALPTECYSPSELSCLHEKSTTLGLRVVGVEEILKLSSSVENSTTLAAQSPWHRPTRYISLSAKRIADVIFAATLLAATAPLFVLIAIMLRLMDGPPIIFHQVRPGLHLKPFLLYKFRTLKKYSRAQRSPAQSDDERRTRFGQSLRRSRLDELPQLWNVLIGDMSLIGPRPLLPRDLPAMGTSPHRRFSVRPGITGLGAGERRP